MAYSNAIFYLDHYNGTDIARTALTTCIASNPSGSITRITKNGHGLVTGAVVTLSLFSSWLNSSWKITVVDANSFDLDDAVWQATADNNGTVTPFGGSSWADAWQTFNAGPTAARLQPGDKVKVCKTPDPVSIGTATWTDGNKEIILDTPLTKTITNCEYAWTPSANVTAILDNNGANRKQGSNSVKLTPAAAFVTGKIAYYTLPATLNLSSYQELCLWLEFYYTYNASQFSIKLCSDAIGDVAVDTFTIPKTMQSHFHAFNLPRDGGGNLGANINSIAIYANSDPGTQIIYLDNIFASTTGGLNLNWLISKNGLSQGGDEPFYVIEYIDETEIGLTGSTTSHTDTWYGYVGVNENVTTYIRKPYCVFSSTLNATMVLNTINETGIEFEFGWNTTTNELTGETFYSTYNGQSSCFQTVEKTVFSGYLSLCFFYYGVVLAGKWSNLKLNTAVCMDTSVIYSTNAQQNQVEIRLSSGSRSVCSLSTSHNNAIKVDYIYACRSEAISLINCDLNEVTFTDFRKCNASSYFLTVAGSRNKVYGGTIANDMRAVYCTYGANSVFNSRYAGITPFQISVTYSNETGAELHWNNRDGNGSQEVFRSYLTQKWQTTVKYLTQPGALEFEISFQSYSELLPAKAELGDIAFDNTNPVTVTVPIKKTSLDGKVQLVIQKNPVVGIVADIKTAKANDTDWELVQVTFTPTSKGVVKVFAYIWSVGGAANQFLHIGKIEAIQS